MKLFIRHTKRKIRRKDFEILSRLVLLKTRLFSYYMILPRVVHDMVGGQH